jgi:predicted AlkP superfamily pyrophosphatase or phosphodiesterase
MDRYPDSIVLVLIDGMRPDGLRASSTPVMDRLIETGSSSFWARSVMPTVTLPCITSLFHSATAETHRVTGNVWTPASDMPHNLFSVVRCKERKTASICNWEELRDISPVGSLDTAIYIDNSYDSGGTGDRFIAKLAAEFIRREKYALTFVYLGHVDTVGHDTGYMSPEYLKAISAADASLGIVLKALDENTTIIVLADHGGHGKEHGSDCDEDMRIPVIASGPGIPRGCSIDGDVCILDVAPTIADLLQVKRPKEWLGRPIPFDNFLPE